MTTRFPLARFGGLVLLLACAAGLSANERMARGKTLFSEHCAACHGETGGGEEGVYEEALFGDKSLKELSRYLDTSMPDGSPEDVTGEDAAAVAAYIYDAFYGPIAQDRLRPARTQAVRLTQRQLRQAVADAVATRDGTPITGEGTGLKGTYYYDRERKQNQKAERVDGRIDFAVSDAWPGEGIPPLTDEEQKKLDKIRATQRSGKGEHPDEYAAVWSGGLKVPETGTYEFTVETTGGFQLFVNSYDEPLLDKLVQSGEDTAYRASLPLLEGRTVPIRLRVKDTRERGQFVRLKWRPPHGVEEVIPARHLVDTWCEDVFVLTAGLPPDDSSTGYPRGNGMSPEWVEAASKAAVEVGNALAKEPRRWTRVSENDGDRAGKTKQYLLKMAQRAWRTRELSEEAAAAVLASFDPQDIESSLRLAAIRVFASPRFLVREVNVGDFGPAETASWVSFGLWDSVPTNRLRDRTKNDQLLKEERLRKIVWEELYDPRSAAKLRDFMHRWLRTDHFHEISKNPDVFPEFDARVAADLRTSLDLFIDDVIWGEDPRWSRLLTSRELFVNERLAKLYAGRYEDVKVAGEDFAKVELNKEPRAGLMSHPYVMAGFSYDKTTSPIHRGVFLSKSILGRVLKSPPDAISPLPPDLKPELSTRERVQLQTQSTTCQSCHSMINPLGFALEHFDPIGRTRWQEAAAGQKRPIDASGVYLTKTGEEVKFNNVRELAGWIAASDEARGAFVDHLFHYATGQPIRAFGPEYRETLLRKFRDSGDNVLNLYVEIIVTSALEMQKRSSAASEVASK